MLYSWVIGSLYFDLCCFLDGFSKSFDCLRLFCIFFYACRIHSWECIYYGLLWLNFSKVFNLRCWSSRDSLTYFRCHVFLVCWLSGFCWHFDYRSRSSPQESMMIFMLARVIMDDQIIWYKSLCLFYWKMKHELSLNLVEILLEYIGFTFVVSVLALALQPG